MSLQIRRGTDTERQTITPVEGEPIYTTDLKQVWIGDGSTVGGIPVGSTIDLEVDGVANVDQSKLNLISGTNVTLSDDGVGGVTINAAGGVSHGVASGTDTYITTIAGVTSLADGDAFIIRFTNGNEDESTLNINGLGAVALYRSNDGEIIGGDIADDSEMLCVYNASSPPYFKCIGTSPNSLFAYVTNDDSVTINKGQPVYAFGAAGDRMSVKLAYNTSDATSAQTYGLVYSSSIAAGQKGFIIIQGVISGLNLSAYSPGDPIYLGATAGSITDIKPSAPNHLVYLGVVEKANAGNGSIYVRIQNGYEIDELHDVAISSPTEGQILQYVTGSPSLWENGSIFGQLFIELNGLGGVIQAPSYTGVSNITYNGTITGWTMYSVNPSTGLALSGSIQVDIYKASSGVPTVSIFTPTYSLPALSSASSNSATSLSISVSKGDTIMAKVISATTCVLVNIQLQITRTG
jgi:hypothetical protein